MCSGILLLCDTLAARMGQLRVRAGPGAATLQEHPAGALSKSRSLTGVVQLLGVCTYTRTSLSSMESWRHLSKRATFVPAR